jgi:hypothetical protein
LTTSKVAGVQSQFSPKSDDTSLPLRSGSESSKIENVENGSIAPLPDESTARGEEEDVIETTDQNLGRSHAVENRIQP